MGGFRHVCARGFDNGEYQIFRIEQIKVQILEKNVARRSFQGKCRVRHQLRVIILVLFLSLKKCHHEPYYLLQKYIYTLQRIVFIAK